MRRSRFLLAAILAAACTTPTGPEPGTLSVKLQDPNAGLDGALLLSLSGPATPTSVTAAPGDSVWGGPFTGTSNQVVVTGQLANGVILTFDVPDVTVVSQYKAIPIQAAATSGYALRTIAGYLLGVTR
ncbi:MAG TPA: hypothetical protein VN848_01655 [Gemmatimonadales bacterium]|nr:hypothetical protein [Gemmatimonadales bacterium]